MEVKALSTWFFCTWKAITASPCRGPDGAVCCRSSGYRHWRCDRFLRGRRRPWAKPDPAPLCPRLRRGSCVGLQGPQSRSGSRVTVPEQQIPPPPQIHTLLQQTGTAGNDRPVTASSSRGGWGRPLSHVPAWAEPAPPPRTPSLWLLAAPPCTRGPPARPSAHRCRQPPWPFGKAARVPGPRTPWGTAGPGAWLRAEAAARRGHINAGRNMLLCASGSVMEHV